MLLYNPPLHVWHKCKLLYHVCHTPSEVSCMLYIVRRNGCVPVSMVRTMVDSTVLGFPGNFRNQTHHTLRFCDRRGVRDTLAATVHLLECLSGITCPTRSKQRFLSLCLALGPPCSAVAVDRSWDVSRWTCFGLHVYNPKVQVLSSVTQTERVTCLRRFKHRVQRVVWQTSSRRFLHSPLGWTR